MNGPTSRMRRSPRLRLGSIPGVSGAGSLIRGVGCKDNMIPNRRNRIVAWVAIISIAIALALLVSFLPVLAAVLFVACVTFVAVAVGGSQGFWRGVKLFIMEILFGW